MIIHVGVYRIQFLCILQYCYKKGKVTECIHISIKQQQVLLLNDVVWWTTNCQSTTVMRWFIDVKICGLTQQVQLLFFLCVSKIWIVINGTYGPINTSSRSEKLTIPHVIVKSGSLCNKVCGSVGFSFVFVFCFPSFFIVFQKQKRSVIKNMIVKFLAGFQSSLLLN